MTYRGVARGRMIELEESLPYEHGQQINVSVEPVRRFSRGTAAAILQLMRQPPHLSCEDVDALERAIKEGKLSVTR